MLGRILGFRLPWDDCAALEELWLGLITLSSGHPWRVNDFFFQDFEEK